MDAIITYLDPNRWKVFKFLPIKSENVKYKSELEITKKQFFCFIDNHKKLNPIFETNEHMYGSYIMIDPLGRLFQNSNGEITKGNFIKDADIKESIKSLSWNYYKFLNRKGLYDW